MAKKKYFIYEVGKKSPIVAECSRRGAEILISEFKKMDKAQGIEKDYQIIEKEVK